METLGRDVLVLLAIELDYSDILKFCNSSNRINNLVCKNNDFWRNKLYRDYPEYRYYKQGNFRQIYKDVIIVNRLLNDIPSHILNAFELPVFLKPEIINFVRNADFGNIIGTNIPLNFLLEPLLQRKILNRQILSILFGKYILQYRYQIDNKNYYKVGPEMNQYLSLYLDEVEKRDKEINRIDRLIFDRNKFAYYKLQSIINQGIILSSSLSIEERKQLQDKNINNLLSQVRDLIRKSIPRI